MAGFFGAWPKFAPCWGWRDGGRRKPLAAGTVVRSSIPLVPAWKGRQVKKPPKKNPQTVAAGKGHSKTHAPKFTGTSNPRHLRAITALLRRPLSRENLDTVAGCSNGPALVAELRSFGLAIPCQRIKVIDRDGKVCRPGVYSLTDADRRKVYQWQARRANGGA